MIKHNNGTVSKVKCDEDDKCLWIYDYYVHTNLRLSLYRYESPSHMPSNLSKWCCNRALMNALLIIVLVAGGSFRQQGAAAATQDLLPRRRSWPTAAEHPSCWCDAAELPACWAEVAALPPTTCRYSKPGLPAMAPRRWTAPWPPEIPYPPRSQWLLRAVARRD